MMQRMQKVLTEMNIQLSNVLSDLSGITGMGIGNDRSVLVAASRWPRAAKRSLVSRCGTFSRDARSVAALLRLAGLDVFGNDP
jgi:hypothetical protein